MVLKEELIDRVMTEIDAKCPVAFYKDEFKAVVEQLLEDDDFKSGWEREFGMPIGKWLVKNDYVVETGTRAERSKRWSLRAARRKYRINRRKWPPREGK